MVNINEINDDVVPTPDKGEDALHIIFNRQRELMEKYHDIEERNGFPIPHAPVDLHDAHAQHKLKDYAWRFTEELTEATEARAIHPDTPEHFEEELADAYHFLVELMTLSGTEHRIPGEPGECRLDWMFDQCNGWPYNSSLDSMAYKAIECLGRAMNCLKNKPWKTTHMADGPKQVPPTPAGSTYVFHRTANPPQLDTSETTQPLLP